MPLSVTWNFDRSPVRPVPPSNSRPRHGFTLIETPGRDRDHLGIDRALLPAVQDRPRGSTGRAQCVNNLKQIGLAIHNYVSVNDCVPPAGFPAWVQESQYYICNGDFSIHARLLPFLEQQNLANAANFNYAVFNSTVGDLINYTVQATRGKVHSCALDTPPGWLIQGTNTQIETIRGPGNNSLGRSARAKNSTLRGQATTQRSVFLSWCVEQQ